MDFAILGTLAQIPAPGECKGRGSGPMRHFSSVKIAILEPNQDELDRLLRFFSEFGHIPVGAINDTDWLHLLHAIKPDIALIDWTGADERRLSTLLQTRECFPPIPIVLCVGRDTPEDQVTAGLDAGADVNITIPIGSLESLARMNALIRRTYPKRIVARGSPIFGEVRFSPGELCVERNGHKIRLSAKEFDIAMLLFKQLSTPVSRRELALVMWGDSGRSRSRGIDTYVSAVRQKLGLHPGNGYSLRAVYGQGYQLDRLAAQDPHPSGGTDNASS